jgi:hypothetical protein
MKELSEGLSATLLLEDLHATPLPTRDVLLYIARQMASRVGTKGFSLVGRSVPAPALAALGSLTEEQLEALKNLSRRLRDLLKRSQYVNYEQLERDCERLAEHLVDHIGHRTLDQSSFVGIPRGGLVTVGILSYTLDLSHSQLDLSSSNDGPLVVVDDCAFTGSRFRRFLQKRLTDREVIFAPLYAHPDLCASVERAEPQVRACVNARDLHDYAPEELGDDHSEWQARWHQRHPDKRYWIGRTEHLCFPWGEADTATWNPEREQVEQGLSVVPPKHRLKTRPETDERLREGSGAVQVQPAPTGPIRPTSSVLFGTVADQTIVTNLDSEVCLALDDTAAAMWHALVEHGTVGDTLDALLDTYTVDRATLRADLVGFAEQLASNDLLHIPDGALA